MNRLRSATRVTKRARTGRDVRTTSMTGILNAAKAMLDRKQYEPPTDYQLTSVLEKVILGWTKTPPTDKVNIPIFSLAIAALKSEARQSCH